jgi:hypothetical protein
MIQAHQLIVVIPKIDAHLTPSGPSYLSNSSDPSPVSILSFNPHF